MTERLFISHEYCNNLIQDRFTEYFHWYLITKAGHDSLYYRTIHTHYLFSTSVKLSKEEMPLVWLFLRTLDPYTITTLSHSQLFKASWPWITYYSRVIRSCTFLYYDFRKWKAWQIFNSYITGKCTPVAQNQAGYFSSQFYVLRILKLIF